MFVSTVKIECDNIRDWSSFHSEFNRVFAFPKFYGKNMNAWIDCMTSLDCPEDSLTGIHCQPGKVITIELENATSLKTRCPDIYTEILECSAFVNWRRIENNEPPVLALSFCV